jgi:hypothetical protein
MTPITRELLIMHGYYPNDEKRKVNSEGLDNVDGKYTLHYGGNNGLWVLFDNDMDEWLILIENSVIKKLLSWEQFQQIYLGIVGKALIPIVPSHPFYNAVSRKLKELN